MLIFSFPWHRNNGSEFGGSIYQKVNKDLETAVDLSWTAGSNGTRFGIAAKYQLDPSASVSVSAALPVHLKLKYCWKVNLFQFKKSNV